MKAKFSLCFKMGVQMVVLLLRGPGPVRSSPLGFGKAVESSGLCQGVIQRSPEGSYVRFKSNTFKIQIVKTPSLIYFRLGPLLLLACC